MKLAIILSIALSANAIESNVQGIRKPRNCNDYCENYKPPTMSEVVCKRELCNGQGLRGATDLAFVTSDSKEEVPDWYYQCYFQCASTSYNDAARDMCVSQICDTYTSYRPPTFPPSPIPTEFPTWSPTITHRPDGGIWDASFLETTTSDGDKERDDTVNGGGDKEMTQNDGLSGDRDRDLSIIATDDDDQFGVPTWYIQCYLNCQSVASSNEERSKWCVSHICDKVPQWCT